MRRPSSKMLLRLAAVLALCGLALMVWAILDPTVMPVMLAMTIGQGIGTLSFLLYLVVVLVDLRRARILRDEEKS